VVGAVTADVLLVAARNEHSSGVFGVELPAAGVTVEQVTSLDPTRPLAVVHFDNVRATALAGDAETLRTTLGTSRALLAAEQAGGAQGCLEMAVEYAKTRVQFGMPIGGFQAIKHICADMYTAVECARTLTYEAIVTGGTREIGMAGASASEAFVSAAEQNMQVHGGISYTWEHDCHLYLKRARASERLITTVREDYAGVLDQSN
jgi:alkylation response protein AidB-like acyl-CoA dehydrogenase